jgi:hypothetical protein
VRRFASLRDRAKEVLKTGWVSIAMFLFAYFAAGFYWALGTAITANIALYVYTRWVYRPEGYKVLVVGDDGSGGVTWRTFNFPTELWATVSKDGISNAITTRYGMAYLAESVEFDEDGIPVHITFAWLHLSTLNFSLKHRLFHEIREAYAILQEQNERYRWMVETMGRTKARELAARELDLIAHADNDPESALSDIAQLRQEAADMRRRLEQMRLATDRGETTEDIREEA